MLKVRIDTSPLQDGNAVRGVGAYTSFLTESLKKRKDLEVVTTADEQQGECSECEADIVHYPYFDLFFATLPLIRCEKAVVTVHDVIPLKFPEQYKPGMKGKLRYYRQLFALHTVHAVITDSQASKSDLVSILKLPEHKVHVVHLAANPQLHHTSSSEVARVRKLYNLPKHYVLYVGDINFNKNLPELIRAVQFLPPEVSLVCVGKNFVQQPIPEWQAIEQEVAKHQVFSRIFFVNNIEKDAVADLAAMYSGALLYIQPSLYEGFGLPVLEALQCGVPVVSTNTSSLLEVGGDAVRFVEPTAESMAQGMWQVLQLPVIERAKVIAKGYTWSQHFSWQKTAHQTLKVYQSLFDAQPSDIVDKSQA